MPATVFFHLQSPPFFAAGLFLTVLAIMTARLRKTKFSISISAAMVCLSTAAGSPILQIPRSPLISVMVDLSPSTRGAAFRDPKFLQQRIHELLGDHPYDLLAFASQNVPLDINQSLNEIPCDQTHFTPVAADDILLFSDAQFDLPKSAPPTFIAVDPELENVNDAAIKNLEIRGTSLAATISNTGPQRTATF